MCEYYHVVPWYNSEEWHEVYSKIYEATSTFVNKEEALQSLLIWKARCPSLPSGIESTLTLLEVYIQDRKNCGSVNQQLLRLAYSSAIMRFVNHMLDTETAKGTSLYQAASRLGIPDWIIDLRHDTAHNNDLPSIQLLREATRISLEWLQRHYWDKHKTCIQDYIAEQENSVNSNEENKIAAVISLCTSLSICSHSNCKIRNLSEIPDAGMQESIVNDIRDLFGNQMDLSNLKKVSVTSLINSINLQSKKLLKSNDTVLHVNKALFGKDSMFLSLELLSYLSNNEFFNKKQLNAHYVQCFEVLLTFLHSNNLILDFIVELTKLSTCSDEDSSKRMLAALWVSEILKALKKCNQFIDKLQRVNSEDIDNKKQRDLHQLFRHWYPNEKKTRLILDLRKRAPKELSNINFVQPIISAYNPYLTYFIADIISLLEPKLPQNTAEKICDLAKMISSPADLSSVDLTSKVYTVDDLKISQDSNSISLDTDSDCEIVNDIETDHGPCKSVPGGIWKIASTEWDWSSCPIGTLPWLNGHTINMES